MRLFLFGLLLVGCTVLTAQNTYTTITQLNNGQQWLRTPDAAALATGDHLLIYQHGGAAINLNGPNTGLVSNLNGAGHYDLNRVARTGGDTVYLALPVTHTYALNASQLVVAPAADSATVTTDRFAADYNGTTGGVLFLAAREQLTIGANISAAATGFRGGIGQEADSDCNRFTVADGETYDLGNWRGSARGEGIAGIPSGQGAGRAPAANGGGGGNDHNTGGGGGSNTARGGLGARNIVMGLFNNACRGNFPGRGGLGSDPDTERLYLGGGGGAGHANNTDVASGGRGGGVIIVWAPSVTFTAGTVIDANGESPVTIDGDGGGGGGGGGSLLIVATDLSGNPVINLRGGKGADVDNPSDRCFGPGGGGGGGRFVRAARDFANWGPNVSLTPGGFGQRLNSSECTLNEEPGGPGNSGLVQIIDFPVPFGGFAQSADTLCADSDLLFTDASAGADQVNWEVLPASSALTSEQTGANLQLSFADTASGTFTVIQTLIADGQSYPGDTTIFTVYPVAGADDATVVFDDETVTVTLDNATGFDSIRYDFGDGTVIDTNVLSLTHLYTEGGDYTVTVTLLNARCGDVQIATGATSLGQFAFADTDIKSAAGCAPFTLNINDISTGEYAGSRWDFPGADTPVVFDELSPTVVFSEPGTFPGTLTLTGALGPDTVGRFVVIVNPMPTADFSFSVDTATAAFTATTDIADEFSWDFGDSTGTSTVQNPVYTYDSIGTFTVVLTASLGICSVTIEQEITIDVLSDVRDLNALGVSLFPNPTSGQLNLTGAAELLDLFDGSGRYLGPLTGRTADLNGLPSGTYVVRVKAGGRVHSVRVIRR